MELVCDGEEKVLSCSRGKKTVHPGRECPTNSALRGTMSMGDGNRQRLLRLSQSSEWEARRLACRFYRSHIVTDLPCLNHVRLDSGTGRCGWK